MCSLRQPGLPHGTVASGPQEVQGTRGIPASGLQVPRLAWPGLPRPCPAPPWAGMCRHFQHILSVTVTAHCLARRSGTMLQEHREILLGHTQDDDTMCHRPRPLTEHLWRPSHPPAHRTPTPALERGHRKPMSQVKRLRPGRWSEWLPARRPTGTELGPWGPFSTTPLGSCAVTFRTRTMTRWQTAAGRIQILPGGT